MSLFWIFSLFIWLAVSVTNCHGAELDAAQLVSKAWAQFRQGVALEQEQIKLRIERAQQAPESKSLTRWSRFHAQGDRVAIKFNEPSNDRGMGLLIQREASTAAPSSMWLRMPSWPQARRIASDRENRYFGGTDLTFEDNRQLMGEALEEFDYRQIKTEAAGVWIEATPKATNANSGYGKRSMLISPQSAVLQINYFDRDGKPLKTQRHEGIAVEPNGRWRANVIDVVNHQEGSRTRLEITQRQFGANIAERIFSPNFLAE